MSPVTQYDEISFQPQQIVVVEHNYVVEFGFSFFFQNKQVDVLVVMSPLPEQSNAVLALDITDHHNYLQRLDHKHQSDIVSTNVVEESVRASEGTANSIVVAGGGESSPSIFHPYQSLCYLLIFYLPPTQPP